MEKSDHRINTASTRNTGWFTEITIDNKRIYVYLLYAKSSR